MQSDQILKTIQQRTTFIGKAVAVFTPIALAVGGYFWYMANVWKPKVSIVSVDYDDGIATLMINGHARTLYTGSTVTAGYGWGVRFSGNTTDEYDRIEIVKNELTFKTISTKSV